MFGQMMDGSMMDTTTMIVCVIGSALFALVFLVLVIIQTVLQAKILREVRGIKDRCPPSPGR